MNPELLANLLWAIASLGLLGAVVYRAFVSILVAEFRHELFAIRRRLFLAMAKNNISPTHPAYTRLRYTINGLLAKAESIGGFDLIVMAISAVKCPRQLEQGVDTTADQIASLQNLEARRLFTEVHAAVGRAIMRHFRRIRYTSPIITVVVLAAILFRLTDSIAKMLESDGNRVGALRAHS